MTLTEVRLDFETASSCELKTAGAWRYAEDPTTEVLSLAYQIVRGSDHGIKWLWHPALSLDHLITLAGLEDAIWIAHNASFEKAIWRRLMVPLFGLPDIPNKRWHCTQAMCAMKAIPQDLDRSMTVLRLPHNKDKEGSKLTISLSKPDKRGRYDRSEATLARVYEYNLSDIDGDGALHERLGWMPNGERQVWLLDQRMNERGVRLDMDFVAKAQEIVDRASGPLLTEFAEITGGLKPTQVQKLQAWCLNKGTNIPNLKAETLKAVLGESDEEHDDIDELSDNFMDEIHVEMAPDVRRALSIRQLIGSASIKKLRRMSLCVCADGRARGLLQYHGAGPGLWAGRLFQPHNFPRGTLMVKGKDGKKKAPAPQIVVDAIMSGDPDFVDMTIGPPVETVVSSLRHAIIAGPGRVLVAGDFAGIQARTVLALAGQHDKTAIMASGADIYLDMATQIYKPAAPFTKEANTEERQIGKNTVLGLGFQMGAPKFRLRYAKEHPLEFSKNVVHVYRKEWAPLVPKVWYGLEAAAVRAVWEHKPSEAYGMEYRLEDGWLSVRLPSGRKIWYFNPKPIRKVMPWDELDVRQAWTSEAMKFGQWRTRDMFGGLLTENVVMGMQRDLLTTALFKCEKEGLPVVLNVHDEIITEPEASRADPKLLAQIMQDIPQWARDMQIPVSVEAWAGDRYKK